MERICQQCDSNTQLSLELKKIKISSNNSEDIFIYKMI